MQNRAALWIFTILLGLACLWQLSFSYFTGKVERQARDEANIQVDSVLTIAGNDRLDRDSLYLSYENKYLRSRAEDQIYPVLKYSYRECKEKEINLGLDLKGGMAVTLEVSIPELVSNLSDNSDNPQFTQAMHNARARLKSSDEDYISLFAEEWDKIDPNAKMAAVFHSQEREQVFPREAGNDQIVTALRKEAETAISNTENIMRERIDKFGVAQPSIQKQQFSGRIQIELPGVKDKERVRKVLQSTANLEFWETYDNSQVYPLLEKANTSLSAALHPELAKKDTAAADSAKTADLKTDTATKAEPPKTADVSAADSTTADSALAETASADSDSLKTAADTTAVDTAKAVAEYAKKNPLFSVMRPAVYQGQGGRYQLAKGAGVGNARIADTAEVNHFMRMPAFRNTMLADMKLLWSAKPTQGTDVLTLYAMKVPRGNGGKPKLDGSVIMDAGQDFDLKGDVEVRMQMNAEGAQIWKVMTADNVGKAIAIVLDDLVYSAPNVISEIPSGNSSITLGSGDLNKQIQEAQDLSNILKAGALPAPAHIIDETVVGPSLGADNIKYGLISFAISLLMVMLFMVAYYHGSGWVSNVALLANVFILLGTLASLQASLTLPGIAGIVLTVGMAVDANVLINERIREELRHGKMLKSAIDLGYKHAMSAIIDANATHFSAAVILYYFGTGPIKSFGTTLALGILTSLFTAIFISRLIITRRLEKGKTITFSRNWNKNLFTGTHVDFMGKRKYFYLISGALIAIGIVSMVTRGFNYGVDFEGGRTYVVKFEQPVDLEQMRTALEPQFFAEGRQYTVGVKTYGGSDQVKVTTNYMVDSSGTAVDSLVEAKLNDGLNTVDRDHVIKESRKVDPTISDDIKRKAWIALAVAFAFMFAYIAVRFRTWQFGLGALLSLVHDALIVVGLYSLLWGFMPFSLEIDEHFIAAILTVIGYSINDTVVVFDRIREYLQDHKRDPWKVVFNKAINSTLGRTINTSVTVLIVLLVIFLLGGVSIKGFVFAMLVGIAVGTYSSIFIASAVVVDLHKDKVPETTGGRPVPATA